MGLGVALAGGIICVTMIAMLSIVYAVGGQIFEINSSRTSSVNLQSTLFQTDMMISDILTDSSSQFVNFTLTNTGNSKLWNYQDFDIVVNYTANVLGSPSQRAEHLTYAYTTTPQVIVNEISTTTSPSCKTCTLSHTVSGTQKLLIVGISIGNPTVAIDTVTYSGQSLTKIRADQDASNKKRTELWYLVNPPSGTADVVVTSSSPNKIAIGAMTLTNVDQSNPIGPNNGSFDNSGTTDPSVSVTTTTDNAMIVDVVSATTGTMTATGSQTERWDVQQSPLDGSAGTTKTTSAGPYTMSWTNDAGLKEWAMSAAAVRLAFNSGCGPSGSIGTGGWLIKSVSNDYIDPDIVNTNEGASICTKLAQQPYSGGQMKIAVSTDNGFTASNSTTIP